MYEHAPPRAVHNDCVFILWYWLGNNYWLKIYPTPKLSIALYYTVNISPSQVSHSAPSSILHRTNLPWITTYFEVAIIRIIPRVPTCLRLFQHTFPKHTPRPLPTGCNQSWRLGRLWIPLSRLDDHLISGGTDGTRADSLVLKKKPSCFACAWASCSWIYVYNLHLKLLLRNTAFVDSLVQPQVL